MIMKTAKVGYFTAFSIIVFIFILVFSLIASSNIMKHSYDYVPKDIQIVVYSNSTRLREGDRVLIKVFGGGNMRDLSIYIEPSEAFTVINEVQLDNSIELEALVRNQLGLQGLFKGYVYLLYKGSVITEKPFYFILSNEDPRIETEGIVLNIYKDFTLTTWHWDIEIPCGDSSKLFIAPRLEGFELLKEYLELQLYIGMITYRNGSWWPLRGLGTYIANKSLEELISITPCDEALLLNVTPIPKNVKGVTVAYKGAIKPDLSLGKYIVKLSMGFNDKLYLYINVPGKYSIASVVVSGEAVNVTSCIYSPPGFKCYLVKHERAILSLYDLKLVLKED
ncbi:MAG: hypothetical protein RMI83_00520 [Desulfurococcaceae archaeon]|nr:hypothetical protein [Sulfolobales archaeon]MDW8169581.1 hypothetical protein [Desulfurococcaceae archaeon]